MEIGEWLKLTEEKDERIAWSEVCDSFGGQHRTDQRTSRDTRMEIALAGFAEEFDIELTVEANGNKPISPLSGRR
jgi:hypothetical protein